ncbi:MAG: hypothetical protein IJ529_01030 [Alphaproteobacteria bacterium]|nr:hypothetical protein [Alphaproteobacteria bacterium]MBQ9234876.1 hypothetical protein [Alphaproteobacteria bacterium]
MDSIKNSFKSRIKSLMTRNKQLDSEIENNDSAVKKSALKDEKEQNNDELRQIRCQRFQQEQVNEDVAFIKQCCQYLQRLGLIHSQHQFCEQFLNKSQHYLSMIICENRKPSPNTIYNLIQNLSQVYDCFMNYDNKQSINRTLLQMMDKGNALITKRILECYRVYNGNRESVLPFND